MHVFQRFTLLPNQGPRRPASHPPHAWLPPYPHRSDGELVVALISRHLVRLLKTAPSLQV
mgnify:CR=1 FL=1